MVVPCKPGQDASGKHDIIKIYLYVKIYLEYRSISSATILASDARSLLVNPVHPLPGATKRNTVWQRGPHSFAGNTATAHRSDREAAPLRGLVRAAAPRKNSTRGMFFVAVRARKQTG
jgi:hypothetical protein